VIFDEQLWMFADYLLIYSFNTIVSYARHGYGRWQAIVDDKDLKIQEIICQELNLPVINLPGPGQVGSHIQNGANLANTEIPSNESRENGGSGIAADGAQGSGDVRNQPQLYQESSMLYHFRDMQRRQVEFVKKRVLLLEKGLNAEYQKEYFVSVSTLRGICPVERF
jgi:chromodomain-helicase-DNA-binding protein 4